uniref:IRG-type G domain-containing protein n=1 Tax=Sphenodon punctatus TaxID=8508 RepID=A0A8D0LB73_SPHPU
MSKEEFKKAVKAGNLSKAVSIAQKRIHSESRYDIGVIGEPGSGMSSFINAIRSLKNEEMEAARISSGKEKQVPISYRHPRYPNLHFWEMSLTRESKYKEQVCFSLCDTFILIAEGSLTHAHIEYARQIQRTGKSFYFVYSKVDLDLDSDMDLGSFSTKERTIRQIQKEYTEGLQLGGVSEPQVFLVSSQKPEEYDFPLLQETLFNRLFSHAREELLSISSPILLEKTEEKQWSVLRSAARAGSFAAVALLGPLDHYDAIAIVGSMRDYYKEFGLDDASLTELAAQAGKSVIDLAAAMKSPPASELTVAQVAEMLSVETNRVFHFLRCLPVVGAGFSMGRTEVLLKRFLATLAEDTNRVLREALKGEGAKSN